MRDLGNRVWRVGHRVVDPFQVLEIGKIDDYTTALGSHRHPDARLEMLGQQFLELQETRGA